MIKLSVLNQKGGVGKTTIALHLAFYLAELGNRVLVIDLDPQANATRTLEKAGATDTGISASQFFQQAPFTPYVAREPGLFVVKADPGMADVEIKGIGAISFFSQHLKMLESSFDYLVVDSNPTMGVRMLGSLVTSDYVLSPIELEDYSIEGISSLLKTIFGVKAEYNKSLTFVGMLPNRVKGTSPRQQATLTELMQKFSQFMIMSKVGDRQAIPEALSQGIPVWRSKNRSAAVAAAEFKDAMAQVLEKIEQAETEKRGSK